MFLGMSPSRTSPSASQTEMNTKEKGDHQSPGVVPNRTPPVTSVVTLDPDHRNQRPGTFVVYEIACIKQGFNKGFNQRASGYDIRDENLQDSKGLVKLGVPRTI